MKLSSRFHPAICFLSIPMAFQALSAHHIIDFEGITIHRSRACILTRWESAAIGWVLLVGTSVVTCFKTTGKLFPLPRGSSLSLLLAMTLWKHGRFVLCRMIIWRFRSTLGFLGRMAHQTRSRHLTHRLLPSKVHAPRMSRLQALQPLALSPRLHLCIHLFEHWHLFDCWFRRHQVFSCYKSMALGFTGRRTHFIMKSNKPRVPFALGFSTEGRWELAQGNKLDSLCLLV